MTARRDEKYRWVHHEGETLYEVGILAVVSKRRAGAIGGVATGIDQASEQLEAWQLLRRGDAAQAYGDALADSRAVKALGGTAARSWQGGRQRPLR